MLKGFFGNLICAIIARMLCGNHLKHYNLLSLTMKDANKWPYRGNFTVVI